MPKEALSRLERMLQEASDFMVPANSSDVTALAQIEALRALTDTIRGLVNGQESFRLTFTEIGETLHTMDKRLDRMENNTHERDINANHERLNKHSTRMDGIERQILELTHVVKKIDEVSETVKILAEAEQRRNGASSTLRALKDYGPWVITVMVVLMTLISSGRLHF